MRRLPFGGLDTVRRLVRAVMACSLVLLLGAAAQPGGFALYTHRHWTLEDGAPPDIWAIAQAPDGFLWLGSGAGLYRFDGVRFERFRPPPGEALPGTNIVSLLVTRSGDLWIGFLSGGVSRLRGGHVRNFAAGIPDGAISGFVALGDGEVWAAVQNGAAGGVSRFDGTAWRPVEGQGLPPGSATDIARDRDGDLWVSTLHDVFVRPAGGAKFVAMGTPLNGEPSHLVADPAQGVWSVAGREGTRFLAWPAPPRTAARRITAPLFAHSLFFDRAGRMWGDVRYGGLFQIPDPASYRDGGPLPASAIAATFGTVDGLSADQVRPFLQDREGTIWVGTNGGLDRFRPASIAKQAALPRSFGDPFLGDADAQGTAYVGLDRRLYALAEDAPPRLLADDMRSIAKVCAGSGGDVWTVSGDSALQRVRGGRVTTVEPVPGRHAAVLSCARDPQGRLWLALRGAGLWRQHADLSARFERPDFPQGDVEMFAFAPSGQLWFVDRAGRLNTVQEHAIRRFSERDGLRVGEIQTVLPGPDDVLVGGDLGLARFDGRGFQTLNAEDYPALSRVTGIAQQGRDTWLFGITALARVHTAALRAAFANPAAFLGARLLDSRDGLPGPALQDWQSNTIVPGHGGRLWLFTNEGVASIDPARLTTNPVAPPVTIRALVAGGLAYVGPRSVTLPRGVTDVQIDYAAPSLAVPERVRVLYRLEGVDAGWIDPGARRQAFYTNLAPGTYRFRVIAANDSGIWNRQGGGFTFVVTPTFTQMLVFKLLCAAAALLAAWAVYMIWLRQIGRTIQMRLEERTGERERIARELHDTLLQGIQGLMLRFQAVANRLPKDNDARHMLDRALDAAEGMIVEGRTSLMELRTMTPPHGLAQDLGDFARRQAPAALPVSIEERGTARTLMPVVHHEAARIGKEALFNALRHARPATIAIALTYGARAFTLTVRDDGVGIDPAIVRDGGIDGHFGLAGMRERARRIRGTVRITAAQGGGTEVSLRVPARIAYGRVRRWWFAPRPDAQL